MGLVIHTWHMPAGPRPDVEKSLKVSMRLLIVAWQACGGPNQSRVHKEGSEAALQSLELCGIKKCHVEVYQ